jgi:putative serine protease PepD
MSDETFRPNSEPGAGTAPGERPEWASPEPSPASSSSTREWPAPPAPATPHPDAPIATPAHAPTTTSALTRARLQIGRKTAALVLVAALAGFVGGRIGDNGNTAAPNTANALRATPAPAATTALQGSSLDALYRLVAPSVVEIVSSGRSQGTGSGVIIDPAGVILTNNHVVSGKNVDVVLFDGTALTGTVAGRDPQQDLAVVRLTNAPQGLVAAQLGNSDDVQPGQAVAAIGSPFGFQGSITSGVVSAINRTFQGNSEYPPMRGLIQTDAAINPGNSGGPLFNLAGEVIGITTAIESPIRGSVGVGFAVPINQAQRALPALVRGTTVQHPFLGIQGEPSAAGGVEIVGLTPGGSADAAGLRTGDVITAIDGVPVASIDEIAKQLDRHGVGKRITLTVRRGNDIISISLTLRAYQGG